jgi:hypothetical protein
MFWNRTRQLFGRPICQFLLMHYSSAHKCSGTPCQVRIEHRAASHFLVTDVIYDVGPATRLLRELRSRSVDLPVIAAFAPFGDPKAITGLSSRYTPPRKVAAPIFASTCANLAPSAAHHAYCFPCLAPGSLMKLTLSKCVLLSNCLSLVPDMPGPFMREKRSGLSSPCQVRTVKPCSFGVIKFSFCRTGRGTSARTWKGVLAGAQAGHPGDVACAAIAKYPHPDCTCRPAIRRSQ